MTKLYKDNEKVIQEKLQTQMEIMCQKQEEKINKYKAHADDLNSRLWNMGDQLVIERQQKENALQRLKELQTKHKEVEVNQPTTTISRKTCKYAVKLKYFFNKNIKSNFFNKKIKSNYNSID